MRCACFLPQASDSCCKQANNVCARAGFVSKTQRGLFTVCKTGPAPGKQLLCTGLDLRLPVPGLISRTPVPSQGLSFPGGSDGKETACSGGDLGSIPGLGRPPGEGNDYLLQYSGLEKFPGQRSLVGYHPWGHRESDTTEGLTLSLQALGGVGVQVGVIGRGGDWLPTQGKNGRPPGSASLSDSAHLLRAAAGEVSSRA